MAPRRPHFELADLFEGHGAKVEALMNVGRDSSDEPYFAQRVRDADLVVLSDGSALHAKSVWHGTLVGEALRECSNRGRRLVPLRRCSATSWSIRAAARRRTGLGYVSGLVIGVSASEEQLARTRSLLGEDAMFAVLGHLGVIHFDGTNWRVVTGDVVTTRGAKLVEL